MSRFQVHSVTGYAIKPEWTTAGNATPATCYVVLDSAICYWVMAEYGPFAGSQEKRLAWAERLAAELNESYP